MLYTGDKTALAYVIGIALGDGNLSNPNKRAVRLRITCDIKYPDIIDEIQRNLEIIAPENRINIAKQRKNCVDIYCYSNDWEKVLGWKVGKKIEQQVSVPSWIKENPTYSKRCLKGLFQSDGSIYYDRKYLMVNFVNCCSTLAFDVLNMIESLGFKVKMSTFQQKYSIKYTVRVATNTRHFIEVIDLCKT